MNNKIYVICKLLSLVRANVVILKWIMNQVSVLYMLKQVNNATTEEITYHTLHFASL